MRPSSHDANEFLCERDYLMHRCAGAVALFYDSGRPQPWPATHCVVVGRKPCE